MKKMTSYLSKCVSAVRVLALLALVFAALASQQAAHANGIGPVCRVDRATGSGGDGASWGTALSLQTAIVTSGCTEIWVKGGVYVPGPSQSDRFYIEPGASGVALYGGFAGTETDRTQRNPATNVTIVSGDIEGNDTNTDGNHIDESYTQIVGNNNYTVVYISSMIEDVTSSTVIDGFTITGGQGPAAYGGGGMFCLSYTGNPCSPKLENLTFSGNKADEGGALYNNGRAGGSNPTLTNVTFRGNRAGIFGGAIFNDGYGIDSSPTLTNVTFRSNSAHLYGGAMFNDGNNGTSSPTLTNVTFNGNSTDANGRGGAMYNDGTGIGGKSVPVLKNVIMWGDTATTGTEIGNDSATPSINYSIVQGGDAGIGGDSGLTAWSTGTGNLKTDPKLGVIANNGGSTKTIALLEGSSAIDTATNTGCPATDQRGVTRPKDGDGNGTATCDIGAYEVSRPIYTATPASWNYGLVKQATTSAEHLFIIKNTGSVNLVIGTVTLAGGYPGQFYMRTNNCGNHTLLPNGTCRIVASFKPTSTGTKTAFINIPDNSWGEPHAIQLSGKGSVELSRNGGFNTYPLIVTNIPSNWTAANFATTDGRDTVNKKEGAASVKIANTSTKIKTLTQVRLISGAVGNTFQLSLWGKGQNIPTTAGGVRAQVLLYSGSTLKQIATLTLPNGTYGFTSKSLPFTATSSYTKVVIKLIYSKGSGSIWFDGLNLLRSP